MRLAEIRVHPIKSCRAVQRASASVEARGLQHDRRYMIVDRTGTFVTLRTLPQLSFIDVEIGAADYNVQLPGGPSFAIPHEPVEGPWVHVGVWGDALWAREHVEAGELLSDWAGLALRLVGMVEGTSEQSLRGGGGPMSFADAWPLLCLSRASVDDVSRRVGADMAVDRFRPNLLFDDVAAYDEDTFGRVRVGSVEFRGAALCSRCVATTIDPVTGAMGTEPLTTLAGYRRFDSGVYLGANLVPCGTGELRVGDGVEVLERAEPRLSL
jgi:uncharacterized protein YcbX